MSEIKGVKVAGGVYSLNDEVVRAALENLKKQLGDGSLVVGLANAVKAGAITLEMLDEKLKLSVSVVNDLETDDALKPLSANQGKVLKELIDIINGTGEGSTDKKITDAIAKLVDEAPENLDTLKEFAEWIEGHGKEVANMLVAINSNARAIADEVARATEAEAGLNEHISQIEESANKTNTDLTEIKKNIASSLHASGGTDSVTITGKSDVGRTTFSVNIPAATTEAAGVITAKDKTKLDNLAVEGADVDLNTYHLDGVYVLSNKKLTNAPILNDSAVSARLTVLTAYDGTSPVITQVLTLNNFGGGEGNIYIRSKQNSTWKPWGKLQTNVEVGQITPDDMSNLIDNGIYSGVCVDGTTVETFVLIVINNYLAASQAGFGSYISQLKYAIDLNRGNSIKTRTRDAYGIWTEWSEIGGSTYELPEATFDTLGGVKLGTVNDNSYTPLVNIDYDSYYGVGIKIDSSVFRNSVDGLTLSNSVAVTKVIWGSNSNMNNYTEPGTYDIYGERTNAADNLPITQAYNGASIAARLTVVASTLQPSETEKCITQFLQLSNRMGGEGNTYIRTYNENNNGLNGWSPWKKQQGMVESYINTDTVGITTTGGQTTGLNGMIENGMYSGIYTDDYTLQAPNFVETFVLVVINDYAVSSQAGTQRRISQLKYATDTLTGQCTVKKRVGTGNDSISWSDWENINAKEFENITSNALQTNTFTVDARYADFVNLYMRTLDGDTRIEKIPAATKEAAGIMTAKDKETINSLDSAIAEGEKRALRRLFVAAGAEYNDTSADKTKTAPWGETVVHKAGHYYLNGLGDITEEQMAGIYSSQKNVLYSQAYTQHIGCRTYFCDVGQSSFASKFDLSCLCTGNYNLEVFGNSDHPTIYFNGGTLDVSFYGCNKLKHIPSTRIYVKNATFRDAFKGCESLITVKFQRLSNSISFSDSPNISKDSILYLINNAQPTSAITITLHPDAYARLADDADVVAALEAKNAALEGTGGSISLVSA